MKEKASGKQISLYGVIDIMKLVFDISHEEAYEIFDEWAETHHTIIIIDEYEVMG
jgi:hypothetical protein